MTPTPAGTGMGMTRNFKLGLILAISTVSVVLDQWTKALADEALRGKAPIEYWDGVVRFVHASNIGAWGSLGASWPTPLRFAALVILPIGALGWITWQVVSSPASVRWQVVSVALFVGGGTGNLIDRVVRGWVLDFVIVGWGKWWNTTNVFNVADVAIVAGALLFLLGSFVWPVKGEDAKAGAPPKTDAA